MKAASINNKQKFLQSGFLTLEMLIALAILIMTFSAVVTLVLGGQTLSLDAELNLEALNKAQGLLEDIRAASRRDFVSAVSTLPVFEGIYTKQAVVLDISPCLKEAAAIVSRAIDRRVQFVELAVSLASPLEAFNLGGDCAAAGPKGGWTSLQIYGQGSLGPSVQTASDSDFVQIGSKKYLFLTSNRLPVSEPDFWVFDVTDARSPVLAASLDTGPGLNAVDVARSLNDGKYYAYAAQHNATGQLQILDVSLPAFPAVVKSCALPGVGSSFPQGRSIYYYNNKVFVGTLETAGNEFHIFDADNPSLPCSAMHLSGKQINHSVRAIIVRGNYAYLATSADSKEVMVLDLADPANPREAGFFNAPDLDGNLNQDEDGRSLFLLGQRLYLGRQRVNHAAEKDFYILNVADPTRPAELGSINLQLKPAGAAVESIAVSRDLAFLGTSDADEELQIWDIRDPSNIVSRSTLDLSGIARALEADENLLYAAVQGGDALQIIASP